MQIFIPAVKVATVGDQSATAQELEESINKELGKLRQEGYIFESLQVVTLPYSMNGITGAAVMLIVPLKAAIVL